MKWLGKHLIRTVLLNRNITEVCVFGFSCLFPPPFFYSSFLAPFLSFFLSSSVPLHYLYFLPSFFLPSFLSFLHLPCFFIPPLIRPHSFFHASSTSSFPPSHHLFLYFNFLSFFLSVFLCNFFLNELISRHSQPLSRSCKRQNVLLSKTLLKSPSSCQSI